MEDQKTSHKQNIVESSAGQYSLSAVDYGHEIKLWIMGVIFFLTLVQLFSPDELLSIFERWTLVIVLLLMGYLWVREVRERDRIQLANDELLEAQVRLENSQVDTIASLVRLVESKAPYVQGHSIRVAQISVLIAQMMEFSPATVETIRRAAMLHDLGRIVMRDEILEKSGALTDREWEIIRQHPEVAENILNPLRFLNLECRIIRHHHERIDGRGYPDGLQGKDIPLESRIIAVAETFDEMNTETFYRPVLPVEKIRVELQEACGTQLDAEVVRRLFTVLENDPTLWRRPDEQLLSKV